MEAVGQPRSGVRIEVPADGVRAVVAQSIKRIDGIALGLAHLLTVLVLHVPQHDDIFVRRLVEDQRRYRQQRVEPPSRLIHRLRDELCGEMLLKKLPVLEGIVILRKRHRARVEPAVDDLRHALHRLAALGTLDGHGIDIRPVQLDIVRAVVRHGPQLLDAADGMLASALALPDIQRRAPVSVSGNAPVLYIFQPVSEASLADALRDPVDRVVVADQVVLDRRHPDEPRLARIVDQRCVTAPAVRIAVLKYRRGKELARLLQILEDHGISLLDKYSRPLRIRAHTALGVHELYQRYAVLPADAGIVLAECGRAVYDAGTVGHGDIAVTPYEECLAVRLLYGICRALIQRLVFLVLEIPALISLDDLVAALAEYLIQQSGRHDIGISVRPDLGILLVGVDAQTDIARQCPWCRRPCQEIRVLVLDLEADDGGALLELLIALSHLVAGERSTAARAVGYDLEALVEQPLIPDLLERPPLGLYICIVIGDVGIVHIRPEADGLGEILPHALISPYALLALLDEGLQTVLLDLLLAVETQLLLDLQLHGQTVSIPSCLARYLVALHRAVARDHVLDDTRQDMSYMRLAVGRRRTVVEHVGVAALPVLDALLEDMLAVPELLNLFLALHKLQVCGDFPVDSHNSSFSRYSQMHQPGGWWFAANRSDCVLTHLSITGCYHMAAVVCSRFATAEHECSPSHGSS